MIPYTSTTRSTASAQEWQRVDVTAGARVQLLTGLKHRRPLSVVELFNQQILYRMEHEPSTKRDSLQTTAGRSSTSSVSYGYAVRNGHLMFAACTSSDSLADGKARRTKRSTSTPSRYRRRPSSHYNAHGDFLAEQSYQIRPLLARTSHKWSFDVFQLTAVSDGSPCMQLGLHIADALKWRSALGIDVCHLRTCLRLVEINYRRRNCYHSAIHAADVTQAVFAFMHEEGVAWMTSVDKLAVVLAAFGHDIRHPGVNQTFLDNSGHFLSKLYGNMSVLENFHWCCLMSILRESRLLEHFSAEKWRRLSEVIRQIILATDMLRQPMYIDQLRTMTRRQSNDRRASLTKENRLLVMQCMVKCADISNPCRPWRLSQEWSYRASTEFFAQGDRERLAGFPVTSSCDRQTTSIPKIQSGFMEFVARPLFNAWDAYMCSPLSSTLLVHLDENQRRWDELTDEVDHDQRHSPFALALDDVPAGDPDEGIPRSPRGRRGSSLPLTSAYLLQSGAHLVVQQSSNDFTTKTRTTTTTTTRASQSATRRRVSLPARHSAANHGGSRVTRVLSTKTTTVEDMDTFTHERLLLGTQHTTATTPGAGGRRHSEPVTALDAEHEALVHALYVQTLASSGAGPRRSSLPVGTCQLQSLAALQGESACLGGTSRGSIA